MNSDSGQNSDLGLFGIGIPKQEIKKKEIISRKMEKKR